MERGCAEPPLSGASRRAKAAAPTPLAVKSPPPGRRGTHGTRGRGCHLLRPTWRCCVTSAAQGQPHVPEPRRFREVPRRAGGQGVPGAGEGSRRGRPTTYLDRCTSALRLRHGALCGCAGTASARGRDYKQHGAAPRRPRAVPLSASPSRHQMASPWCGRPPGPAPAVRGPRAELWCRGRAGAELWCRGRVVVPGQGWGGVVVPGLETAAVLAWLGRVTFSEHDCPSLSAQGLQPNPSHSKLAACLASRAALRGVRLLPPPHPAFPLL